MDSRPLRLPRVRDRTASRTLSVDAHRLDIMGRLVDLDDLIDVGEVAALLGLAHKNSVTT